MSQPVKISECLESVHTPAGRERVAAYLQAEPFPHFEQHPDLPGMFVCIDEHGRRTTGRFINRQFQPLTAS